MNDQNTKLRAAIREKARSLIAIGKDIFSSTFTNGVGDPTLDFRREGE